MGNQDRILLFSLQSMTMMFEVQDLAVASPATVSRCGMVYLEPSILGLQPFVECWIRCLPDSVFDHSEKFKWLFDKFLEVCQILICDIVWRSVPLLGVVWRISQFWFCVSYFRVVW